MQLSTPVEVREPRSKLEIGTPVLAVGSCFAERVGARLDRALFPTTINPTGIYYNPISLAETLAPEPVEPDLFLHHGLWRSLDHHSFLSGTDREQTVECFKKAEEQRIQALREARILLLTLGTSQAWRTASRGRIVANCHRLPSSTFSRSRLSVEECVASLAPRLDRWLEESDDRQVVLTVSPVRYRRDGLIDNSRGKAVLLLACEELEEGRPGVSYFPSYEIFVDELRDYRFYEQDLVQPNSVGVEFVWERFQKTFLSHRAVETLPLIERIQRLAEHRLTPRSKPAELGAKGLALLDQLKASEPQVRIEKLSRRFQEWVSAIR